MEARRDWGFFRFGSVARGTHGTFGGPRPTRKSAGFGAAGPKDEQEEEEQEMLLFFFFICCS